MSQLSEHLLAIIACPCPQHAKVVPDDPAATTKLVCTRCRTSFEVSGGYPNMILQDATPGPCGIGNECAR